MPDERGVLYAFLDFVLMVLVGVGDGLTGGVFLSNPLSLFV